MNTIIVRINIENEGWQVLLRTTQKQPLENVINEILNYDEFVKVKISYMIDTQEYPIIEFNNRKNKKQVYLQDVYRIVARNPQI